MSFGLYRPALVLLKDSMVALFLVLCDHLYYLGIHASHWEHLTEGQIADHKD